MTLRKLLFLVLAAAVVLSAYVLLERQNDKLFIACVDGQNSAEVISACTKLIEQAEDQDALLLARLHVSRAQKYLQLDQYQMALHDLDRAIAFDSKTSENYTKRAITYAHLGEYDAALADFEVSLALSPSSVTALRARGNTHRAMHNYSAALDDYGAVLAIRPEDVPSLKGQSQVLVQLNRWQDALEATSDLLSIAPDDIWALKRRASLFANAEQFQPAIRDIERYIAISPNSAEGYGLLGHYLGKSGQTVAAVAAFDRAIALEPQNISPLIVRIGMWLEIENYERAAIDAERAYELSPNNDTVLVALFTANSKLGQDELADRYLDLWSRQQPEFMAIQEGLQNRFGTDHPMADVDTHIMLFKGFIYGSPPLERTDIALETIENYFEAGGPESVLFFQRFLDRIGLYRGDFSGIYDDGTSQALQACLGQSIVCLREWSKQTAL